MNASTSTITDQAGTVFQLSVNVTSTDVFLFPFKQSRSDDGSGSLEQGLDSSPAYTEDAQRDPGSSSTSVLSTGSVSNKDYACLYAYCEIQVLSAKNAASSSSSSSPARVANTLKSLSLSLIGKEQITFPKGGHETSQTYYDSKSITEALVTELPFLQVGKVYSFERSFLVDHNTAPFQRSTWGINNQKVVAKAVLHSPAKARLSSLLGVNKTLTASKKVYFVECHPSETSDEMIVHDKQVRTHADGLGPFVLSSHSQVFTVGGYMRTNLDLLSPLDGVKVVGLRGYVEQKTTLASRKDRPGFIETLLPRKIPFLDLDATQVQALLEERALAGGGEGVSPEGTAYPALEVVSRLPDDRKLRPSTVDGNDAAIRFQNSIHYEIDFIDGQRQPEGEAVQKEFIYIDGQKLKRFHVAYNAFIHSCGCRPDSLSLPIYACKDPMPEAAVRAKARSAHEQVANRIIGYDKQFDPSAYPCICTNLLQCLLDTEKQNIAASIPFPDQPAAVDIHPLPTYKHACQDAQH